MLDYKFNEEDIKKYYQLSNKTEFLQNAKSIDLYFTFYQKNSKGTYKALAKVLEDRNINLYQVTLDYFNNGSNSPRSEYALLEILVSGLKLKKIDLDNINNINGLEKIVKLSFFCEAKYVLENQLSILKNLIQKEDKYVDLLLPLLTKMSENNYCDIAMQKQIKNYVENLPMALINYPELKDIYKQLKEKHYLTTNHYHCYNIDLDCNAVANTNDVSTASVNIGLKKAFTHIETLLQNKEIFNQKNSEINYVNSIFKLNNSMTIEGQIIVKDIESYEVLHDYFDMVIDELIKGIVNQTPYTEKSDISNLINKCCLFQHLDSQVQNKEDVKQMKKMKI